MANEPYISSAEILAGVKTAVEALRLPDDSGPLFQLVRLFDSTDVDRAFAEVFVARQQRLCFVLPGRDTYTRRIEGVKLFAEKRAAFALLICDTDRKTGQAAVFGGPANQGVLALKDAVIEGLTGAQLGLPWVVIEPDEGDDLTVVKDGDSDAGRKGWFQLFETRAGVKNVPLR